MLLGMMEEVYYRWKGEYSQRHRQRHLRKVQREHDQTEPGHVRRVRGRESKREATDLEGSLGQEAGVAQTAEIQGPEKSRKGKPSPVPGLQMLG